MIPKHIYCFSCRFWKASFTNSVTHSYFHIAFSIFCYNNFRLYTQTISTFFQVLLLDTQCHSTTLCMGNLKMMASHAMTLIRTLIIRRLIQTNPIVIYPTITKKQYFQMKKRKTCTMRSAFNFSPTVPLSGIFSALHILNSLFKFN